MQKNYNLFKIFYPIILAELGLVFIFGTLSFKLCYNYETCTLFFNKPLCIIFIISIILTIATALCFALMSGDGLRVARIKKDFIFLMVASCFAAIMAFVLFVFRVIGLGKEDISAFKVIQTLLLLPLGAYFVLNVFSSKNGENGIKTPKEVKYALTICAIVWAILGIFSMYFYNEPYFFTNNIFKTTQILIYVAFSALFLFEARFEHFSPNYKMYIFSAFVSAALTFAFSAGVIIAKISKTVPKAQSLSMAEVLCSLAIGIYALSRIFALFQTIKYIPQTLPANPPIKIQIDKNDK